MRHSSGRHVPPPRALGVILCVFVGALALAACVLYPLHLGS